MLADSSYTSEAVMCVGVPFGYTQPQWIMACGGSLHLDRKAATIAANLRLRTVARTGISTSTQVGINR